MESTMENKRFKVLMLPWLAHGHISPFLELAKRLTTHNFHIYLCSTAVNLSFITKTIAPPHSQSIELVELYLPTLPNLPPHHHTTNGLPPHLMTTLKLAHRNSAAAFTAIIQTLRPNVLIYDYNQSWAADAATALSIPCVQFLTGSAAMYSFALHFHTKSSDDKYPFQEIILKDQELVRLKRAYGKEASGVKEINQTDALVENVRRSCGMVLIKTTREIEGKYVDYLSRLVGKKVVPTGPLIRDSSKDDDGDGYGEIGEWLDQREDSSVVFVSFGSEYFLSTEEIEDVAVGLELSGIGFIWVLRFPEGKKVRVQEALPDGFLARVAARGLVVAEWAPQGRILGHRSIGGFVSHCGWGSVMESIYFGVPIVAVPMQLDQPFNARVVEKIGVAVDVGRGEDGRLKREEIAAAVRMVVAEEGGGRMRKKVRELSEVTRGRGDNEIDRVVREELIQLCKHS